jgi:hypothetical protein
MLFKCLASRNFVGDGWKASAPVIVGGADGVRFCNRLLYCSYWLARSLLSSHLWVWSKPTLDETCPARREQSRWSKYVVIQGEICAGMAHVPICRTTALRPGPVFQKGRSGGLSVAPKERRPGGITPKLLLTARLCLVEGVSVSQSRMPHSASVGRWGFRKAASDLAISGTHGVPGGRARPISLDYRSCGVRK